MQLNNAESCSAVDRDQTHKASTQTSIGMALAAATCSLLGMHASPAIAEGRPGTWDVDAAVLIYQESNGRVQAAEPVISATRNFDSDARLNLKAVVDTLTGASPYGATPSDELQTFTSPSGNSSYEITPNSEPLDDSFHDSRVALSATWSAPIDRDWNYSAGVYGSSEFDYQSIGLNGSISRYLNNKNTTLTAGLSSSFDEIKPEGAIPFGLARMLVYGRPDFANTFAASRETDSDNKVLVDLLLGVTQIINRRTIMQLNYSLSMANGYMTDPFKILSVIDNTPGANYGGNFKADGANVYLYEQRPDSRMKNSLFAQTKYMRVNGDVIDGSYRLMIDDWGITSHTFDLKYRWQLGASYLEPHVRYYSQSKADFYHRYLTSTEYTQIGGALKEASADYRLGDLTTYTVGFKYGYQLNEDQEIGVRIEAYKQANRGDAGIGKLAQQNLYPDTDAMWLQLNYNF